MNTVTVCVRPAFFVAIALALSVSAYSAAAELSKSAGELVSVSVARTDMRNTDIETVHKRASDSSKDGIVLVVYGDDAEALSTVEGAALDAVALRLPVTSIILAPDADGTGVSVYGIEGAPFGPRISVDSNLHSETKNRIQELAVLQGKAGMVLADNKADAAAAPDPDDVIRCRTVKETGSRLRGVRICSSPRQDRERAQQARDSADEMTNKPYTTNDSKIGGG